MSEEKYLDVEPRGLLDLGRHEAGPLYVTDKERRLLQTLARHRQYQNEDNARNAEYQKSIKSSESILADILNPTVAPAKVKRLQWLQDIVEACYNAIVQYEVVVYVVIVTTVVCNTIIDPHWIKALPLGLTPLIRVFVRWLKK